MINGLLGKKLGMSQVFAADGQRIPVTVLEAGPCTVLQKKTVATDGYDAVQVGFGTKKVQRVNKPEMGHFKKTGKGAFAHVREFKAQQDCQVGDEVDCTIFKPGERIDVIGNSKGKGYQGVIKRWGFSGGRASHSRLSIRSTTLPRSASAGSPSRPPTSSTRPTSATMPTSTVRVTPTT